MRKFNYKASMDEFDGKRWLNIKSLARYIDAPVGSIRYWCSLELIPSEKIGRLRRFDRVAIDEWIKKYGGRLPTKKDIEYPPFPRERKSKEKP